jgi:DNA polymerase family B
MKFRQSFGNNKHLKRVISKRKVDNMSKATFDKAKRKITMTDEPKKPNKKFKKVLKHQIKKCFEQVIGAWDIETVPSAQWIKDFPKYKKDHPSAKESDGALFGDYADGFLKYDDDPTYYRADSMLDMCNRILSRGNVILYAHNARGYEFKYLLKIFQEYYPEIKMQCILSGESHIIALIIPHEDGKIELRDSLALIPMTLKDACKKLKTKTQKEDIGLDDGHIYDRNNPIDVHYCQVDVQANIEIVQKVIDLTYEVFGCGIGFTTAATAIACFKATIPEGHTFHRMTPRVEKFCRDGYYGGFVYCGRDCHRHDNVISIDRNASFAASMRDGVPVGPGRLALKEEKGKLGIFKCRVFAPNDVSMVCVPMKTPDGLKWPLGTFETVITTDEMFFARAQGYTIIPIKGIVWDRVEYPFNDIVDKCERIEIEHPELKEFIKLIRNALYGKFGTKFVSKEVVIGMPDDPTGWAPLCDEKTGALSPYCWCRETENDSEYIMPHWAAFITARARLWVFKTMLGVGMESVYYGDTDSVKADADAIKKAIREGRVSVCCPEKSLSDASSWVREYVEQGIITTEVKYGSAKVDEEYQWFQTLGPKVYHGVLVPTFDKEKNKWVSKDKMRAKGIPMKKLTHDIYQFAYDGLMSNEDLCAADFKEKYFPREHFRSSNSTMVLLKKSTSTIDRQVQRSLTNFAASKTWVVNSDGSISPPTLCMW